MRVANCSSVLDKNLAPMGPEILSSTGVGVWRKAPKAFPDFSSALDKFQSAMQKGYFWTSLGASFLKCLLWYCGSSSSGIASCSCGNSNGASYYCEWIAKYCPRRNYY